MLLLLGFACIPSEKRIPELVSRLVEAKHAGQEKNLVRCRIKLEKIGSPAAPYLIELFSHPDLDLQTEEVTILLRIGQSATPYLITALQSSHPDTIFNALRTLELIKDTTSLTAIRPHLNHPQSRIAFQAARTLAAMNDSAGFDFLREKLHSSSAEARTQALNNLAELRDDRLVEDIAALLQDPDAYVKLTAIDTLLAIKSRKAVPFLEKYGLNDPSWKIRQRSAFALSKITDVGYKYVNEEGKLVFSSRY